jgi:hypothetical protein
MAEYNYSVSGSTYGGYSTIFGGYNCSISSYPTIVSGAPNISAFSSDELNSIYKTIEKSSSEFKSIIPEKKRVKLRYNHQCTSSKDMWKLYIDDDVHIVGLVNFHIPTATTLDYDELSKDYKSHVSCNARFVKFETMPDGQIIATVS